MGKRAVGTRTMLTSLLERFYRTTTTKRKDKQMRTQVIDQIAESYINGNISWVKNEIKKMSKVDFLYFIKVMVREYNVCLDKINNLL